MLSYQHGFHAGNFADVHKHLLLSRVLAHLRQKDTPFCYLETHAGRGIYDLNSPQAQKNREWKGGIARIWHQGDAPASARNYLETVAALNPDETLSTYPGSPRLALELLREQDRMILMEMHPAEFPALQALFKRERRVAVHKRDGFEGLNALVPPKEKRGAVLIDPSYEVKTEYRQAAENLIQVYRKWPAGIYLIWYPLLPDAHHHELLRQVQRKGIRKVLRAELLVRENSGRGMYGSGVLIVNPPWTLFEQLQALQPWLLEKMAQDGKASHRIEWLVEE